jgi:hypothetical protein
LTEEIEAEFPTPSETIMFINYDFGDKAATSE